MPPKAAYKQFEAEPELEFWFFLSVELGIPISELMQRTSHDDFIRYYIYYARKAQRDELANKGGK